MGRFVIYVSRRFVTYVSSLPEFVLILFFAAALRGVLFRFEMLIPTFSKDVL